LTDRPVALATDHLDMVKSVNEYNWFKSFVHLCSFSSETVSAVSALKGFLGIITVSLTGLLKVFVTMTKVFLAMVFAPASDTPLGIHVSEYVTAFFAWLTVEEHEDI
jgi:hypothetical protein